jgi:hypothetical protein
MKLKIIIEDVDVSDNKLELLLALLAGKDVEVQKNEPVNDGVNLDDLPTKPKKVKTEVKTTKKPRGRPPAGKVWDEDKGTYVSKPRYKRPRGRPPAGKVWDENVGMFVSTVTTESKGKKKKEHIENVTEVAKAKAKRPTTVTKPEKKGKKKGKNGTSGWTAEKRKAAADRMRDRQAKLKADKGRAAYPLLTNVEVRDMVAGVVVERQNSMVSSDLITTSYFAGIQKKYHARDANLLAEKTTLGNKVAKYLEVLADALGPTQAMGMKQGDSYNVGLFPKKELKLKKVTKLIGLQS